PALFPELFMHAVPTAPDAPPPPPGPATETAKPATQPETPSDEATAKQSLDDARAAFPPEAIDKDPTSAFLAFARVAADHGDTAAGKSAAKEVAAIRKKYADTLEAANKTAQDELAAFVAKEPPLLGGLEHPTAIAELANLRRKWMGLEAADAIAKERDRIQALWDAVPAAERTALQKFHALLKDPKTRELKLDTAVAAHDIATVYSMTVYGKKAAARCDELALPIADEIDDAAVDRPKFALTLAAQFPKQLDDTPAGARVAKARDRARSQLPEGNK
ncbi:MAG TPA: hypothetical protein VFF73_03775, partial [Planctomycetota bacterium]|nr:hypothetical protein [Planctomycetota bacterium]